MMDYSDYMIFISLFNVTHFLAPSSFLLHSFSMCDFRFAEKEGGKAVTVTYKDKLKLMALTKQVTFGKYRPDNSPDVGFLDVVGKDRR